MLIRALSPWLVLIGLFLAACQSATPEQRFDAFVRDEGLAGGVMAIGRPGAPPLIHAVGQAAPGRPMRADDSFLLASLSKPVTAAAVLGLVRAHRLGLETVIPELGRGITIRDLLRHSGGWDRDRAGDPIGDPAVAARFGPDHPDCMSIARAYPPDQFAPGRQYAYSNIGYCWLGFAIERASGEPYAGYVENAVLRPHGIRLAYAAQPSVAEGLDVPLHRLRYGPGGAWVGTAAAYWRFAALPVDPLVRSPPPFAGAGDENYYGLGWRVWRDGSLTHFGAVQGAFGFVYKTPDLVAVFLLNGRPADDDEAMERLRTLAAEVRAARVR